MLRLLCSFNLCSSERLLLPAVTLPERRHLELRRPCAHVVGHPPASVGRILGLLGLQSIQLHLHVLREGYLGRLRRVLRLSWVVLLLLVLLVLELGCILRSGHELLLLLLV